MAKTKNTTTIVNGRELALAPTEHDLEDLDALRQDMSGRIDKAREDGRLYMMNEYVLLLSQVTSKINKIQARFNRDTLASMRKEHADLRAEARAAIADAKDAKA